MGRRVHGRKGFFFTFDSFLGTTLLLLGMTVFSIYFLYEDDTSALAVTSYDSADFLSHLNVADIGGESATGQFGLSGESSLSVLEQIAVLWIKGDKDDARGLSKTVMDKIIPPQYGYSIWVGGDEVYSSRQGGMTSAISTKKMVSGVEEGRPVKGYLTYIHLSSMDTIQTPTYTFFGGYTGQGNISLFLDVPMYEDVLNITIEGDFSDNFSLEINGAPAGDFVVEPGKTGHYSVSPMNFGLLKPGRINDIGFHFPGNARSFVGGGFVKALMNVSVSQLPQQGFVEFSEEKNPYLMTTDFLPSVRGFINLYSSFPVPPGTNSIHGRIHFRTDWDAPNTSLILTIGNVTVFRDDNVTGEQVAILNTSAFQPVLADLALAGGATVPLRLGFSRMTAPSKSAVSLITDVSSSMSWCVQGCTNGILRRCDDPYLFDPSTARISLARCLDKTFLENIDSSRLNVSLVSFSTSVINFTSPTSDILSLERTVSGYQPLDATCIPCGIVRSTFLLLDPVPVIPTSSRWNYTLSFPLTNPGPSWYATGFDDRLWLTGNASMGFGYAVNTLLPPTALTLGNFTRDAANYSIQFGRTSGGDELTRLQSPDGWALSIVNDPLAAPKIVAFGNSSFVSSATGTFATETRLQDDPQYRVSRDCVNITRFRTNFGGSSITPGRWYVMQMRPTGTAEVDRQFLKVDERMINGFIDAAVNVTINPPFTSVQENDTLGFAAPVAHDRIDSDQKRIVFGTGHQSALDDAQMMYSQLSISGECVVAAPTAVVVNLTSLAFPPPMLSYKYSSYSVTLRLRGDRQFNYTIRYYDPDHRLFQPLCTGQAGTAWQRDSCTLDRVPVAMWIGGSFTIEFAVRDTSGINVTFDDVNFTGTIQQGSVFFRRSFPGTSPNSPLLLSVMSDDRAQAILNSRTVLDETLTSDHPGARWNTYTDIVDGLSPASTLAAYLMTNDRNATLFDAELSEGMPVTDGSRRAMVIMSDGASNVCFGDPTCANWTGHTVTGYPWCDNDTSWMCRAANQTIYYACEAKRKYGISVYAVSFAPDGGIAVQTLNQSACCDDCSHFYTSHDPSELDEIYRTIAHQVSEFSYYTQSANFSGNFTSTLFNDSYFIVNSSLSPRIGPFSSIPFTVETPPFGDNATDIPVTLPNATFLNARLTSYSGDRWTESVEISNKLGNWTAFNLTAFGTDYLALGDPFLVDIPLSMLVSGDNRVSVSTALNPANRSGGSPDDRLIYTVFLRTSARSGNVQHVADGCRWTVEFEDGRQALFNLPKNASDVHVCSFTALNHSIEDYAFDPTDAVDSAVANLFNQLDMDQDGRIDYQLEQNNFEVSTEVISDIPFLWGPTVVEIKIWK